MSARPECSAPLGPSTPALPDINTEAKALHFFYQQAQDAHFDGDHTKVLNVLSLSNLASRPRH